MSNPETQQDLSLADSTISSQASSKADNPNPPKTTSTISTPLAKQLSEPSLSSSPSDKLNWFCFFIFGHGVYFNENYYSVLAPELIGTNLTAIMVLFIHLPKFLFKLSAVYFVHKISTRTRVWAFTGFSILSSVLILIFYPEKKLPYLESSAEGITTTRLVLTRLLLIVVVSISCMSMALGEITLLGYSKKFSRNCVNGWSSGSGLAGFTAGTIQLGLATLLKAIKHENAVKYLMIVNALIMLTVPLFFFCVLKEPKRNLQKTETDKTDDTNNRNKKNYTLASKLKMLFVDLKAYSWPLLIGYMIYFLCFSGIIPFIKDYNKDSDKFEAGQKYPEGSEEYKKIKDQSANFFTYAFIILRFGVFVCRSLPQVIEFYQVWMIPFVHIFSIVGLIIICFHGCNKLIVIFLLIPLGFGHGAVVGYSNLGLRNRAPSHLKEVGLSYINIASALGATLGNSLAFGAKAILDKFLKFKP